MDRVNISFLDDDIGIRHWFIDKGFGRIVLTTDELKYLFNQLETHKDLDWKSPF